MAAVSHGHRVDDLDDAGSVVMPGLRDILDAATRIYPGTTDGYMRKVDARLRLDARSPELAALCLDMGDVLAEIRQNGRPDFGDCGARTCEHPGCLYTRNFDGLLARLDRLGKEPSDG